jgi:hypothetical protein
MTQASPGQQTRIGCATNRSDVRFPPRAQTNEGRARNRVQGDWHEAHPFGRGRGDRRPGLPQTTTDAQTQTDTSATATAPASAAEQAGGYQPATPPMSAPAAPGATVVFQPSESPSQAFPPPAALDHYPPCKAGQTDKCMQRGGR